MKKMIGVACVAACVAMSGCKSVPEPGSMYTMSFAIGVSAGLVANETKIDDTTRNEVIEIINIVSQCTPETNQTFEAAWTPIAQAHTDKLIADGKIDAAQGQLIMAAFSLVVKGLDYIFEVRYPEAKQYKELVVAAIDGFSSGFLTVFKPANTTVKSLGVAANYDQAAYDWLKGDR